MFEGRRELSPRPDQAALAGAGQQGRPADYGRAARWLAIGLAGSGLGLLPWMYFLAVSLPASTVAWHWPAAWVGLDAMEAAGLFATGFWLLRRDARYCLSAMASAALLVTDAWFDVNTAPPGTGELESVAMAAGCELPAAVVCLVLAVSGLRRLMAAARGARPESQCRQAAPAGRPEQARPRQRPGRRLPAGRARAGRPGTGPGLGCLLPGAGAAGLPAAGAADGPAGRLSAVRVLVLGSGGREHALTRALSRDPAVTQLHAAPGNPGIGELAELHPVRTTDPAEVTGLARRIAADLVVVGPEAPLIAGVPDALRAAGLRCFGPDRAAAMIEGSKSFAKQVMTSAGVPTAAARTCRTEAEVSAALDEFGPPYVVKADGLAAGKGVVVTADRKEAEAHARSTGTVVIEEFLDGPEVSVFALADGKSVRTMQPAQDYKRARDGDAGPNTGGVGAYAPLPWAPPDLSRQTQELVVEPALAELARLGSPYSGVLYVGLCLTSRGLRVVEFNARFGDPETQVLLDRLETPLGGVLAACAEGDLGSVPDLRWRPGATVTVVIAAEGYPAAPVSGDVIDGLAEAGRVPGTYVLQAGTATDSSGQLTASGGRVLNVVASGADLPLARAAAYEAAGKIRMRRSWYRSDIAAQPAPGTRSDL
jgi:phosphoribosylamine--glycine ligase